MAEFERSQAEIYCDARGERNGKRPLLKKKALANSPSHVSFLSSEQLLTSYRKARTASP